MTCRTDFEGVARWGGRQQPRLFGGLRCKPEASGPECAQRVSLRGANSEAWGRA
jgi:hypothetical protein